MKLLRIFKIDVNLHFSWWIIFILLSLVLSTNFFPHYYPGLNLLQYWFLGLVSALLLFGSVLLHELSHSLVARWGKLKVESITLFFFGGVAAINREDIKPKVEFWMALAGPLFSLILAGLFFLIEVKTNFFYLGMISFYLARINLILACFNLIPAYPLDGGRAFRALLHYALKDLMKATRIAVFFGKAFAIFLMVVGFSFWVNHFGNGLWMILLGMFIYFIANTSYRQLVISHVLKNHAVRDIMIKNYKVYNPEMKFNNFVKEMAKSEETTFVVSNRDYKGLIDVKDLNKDSQNKMLSDLAIPLSKIKGLKESNNLYLVYQEFAKTKLDILPVKRGRQMVGIVKKRMLEHYLIWELKYGL
jgi:Zn-dependent protease